MYYTIDRMDNRIEQSRPWSAPLLLQFRQKYIFIKLDSYENISGEVKLSVNIVFSKQEKCVEDWPEDSPELDPDFKPVRKHF